MVCAGFPERFFRTQQKAFLNELKSIVKDFLRKAPQTHCLTVMKYPVTILLISCKEIKRGKNE